MPCKTPWASPSRDDVRKQLVADQAPIQRLDVCISREGRAQGVKSGPLEDGDGGVKVGYADAWLKSRTGADSQIPMPKMMMGSSNAQWTPAEPSNAHHSIPIAELSRPDPILFYAEIPLFEDELHDNGASHLLRVMPTCIFILSRFTLRVDNVLFRAHDTRIYHSFASAPPLLVRETRLGSAVRARQGALPRRDDLMPLTDPNFICKVLSDMPKETSQEAGAGTGWRGLGTVVQVHAAAVIGETSVVRSSVC
ncbi:TIP41-like family-domain-containing protein [Lactarius quietus]|nr:TIP41-like family-domain-containing protein [Lactarius quietus]